MKFSIHLIILCAFLVMARCEIKIKLASNLNSDIAVALNVIIDNYFLKTGVPMNLLSPEKVSLPIKDFKEELLSSHLRKFRVVVKQDTSADLKMNTVIKRRGVFLLIETFENFKELYAQISSESFKLNTYYFIVMLQGEIKEIEKIFKLLWDKQISSVIAIFRGDEGAVQLKTFNIFTKEKCDDFSPYLLNEFKNGNFTNGTENMFPRKTRNMHECPVRMAASNNSEPYVFIKKFQNGTFELKGRDISMVEALSKVLNFKLQYTYVGDSGYIFNNGTAAGAFEALLNGEADISATNWLLKQNRLKFFDRTTSHTSETMIFLVPSGKEYTSVEQMIYPFRIFVWLAVSVFLLIGFIVIFIIKFQSKDVQNFVFGADNQTPYMNMLVAVYGGSQKKLPRRNFARFLLMMFLIYSLIIRACYTGSYYKLLRSSERHGEVSSIQEMIDENFTFYVGVGVADLLTEFTSLQKRVTVIDPPSREPEIFEKIRTDPDFKATSLQALDKVLYRNINFDRRSKITICREIFNMIPVVIYARRDYFLVEVMNEKIELFKSAGLIEFWDIQNLDRNSDKHNKARAPKGLTLNQLRGGFQFLGCGLLFGFVAFLAEVFRAWIKRRHENKVLVIIH